MKQIMAVFYNRHIKTVIWQFSITVVLWSKNGVL